MATRTEKIGLQSINRLQPGDTIWDTELKRFGARRRSSRISYVVKAQIDRRQRWITIGQHGPLTPSEARAQAKTLLGSIDSGHDPTREITSNKKLPVISDVAKQWLTKHVEIKRRPSTATEYRRIIEKHIKPTIGNVRIDRLTRADAMELHASYSETPYAGNRVIAVLSAMLTYAERMGYRTPGANPVRGIERYAERKRKNPLSTVQLRTLWFYLNSPSGNESPWAIAALKLLMLTGCRKREILTLQWKDVDLKSGTLHLKDTKTGERDVMLSRLAVDTLEAVPRIDDNPFVICGARPSAPLINVDSTWKRARNAIGIEGVRIHDLRHSVASTLALNQPMIVVRDALGHRQMQTTNGYSHAANDDVRKAINGFADMILEANDR